MTLCFLDETDEHGTFAEVGDIVDGATPHNEYIDEMLALSLSPIEERVHPRLTSPFDLFEVSFIEIVEEIQTAPTPEIVQNAIVVVDLIDGPAGLIFDIDDEIAQHDSDDDSSSVSDSDPVDQRVSPAVGDTEIVDFGTADQPRELRIGSDCLQMREIASSSCSDPTWTPVKQKLRQLHPRWSLQDGKVRVCVDFRYLNKASPKDDFPLPHINMLVDSTAGHSMLSFMDGFSGYSQILMAPEDMEKTSFITEWVQIETESQEVHFWSDFWETLGYMVSEQGIEVDPDKIRVILDMPAPSTERECQRAFERIREYLLSPPVLAPPTPGRPLLLYLSVSDMALGCMLAQLDDSGKRSSHLLFEPALVGRLMRWLVLLTKFDIHYVTQKSIRGSIVADHLASLPVSDGRAIDDDFPNEDVAVVTSLSGAYRHPATNNIVNSGKWKTRDVKLRPYHAYLELLVGRFDDLRYTHPPRAQNQFANALATLASMMAIPTDATVRPLLIESRFAPAYIAATAKDRRALRQLATRFVIYGETLYRRSPDGMLLLCLDRVYADRVMREVHAGVCGPHMGGHMLAHTRRSHSRAAIRVACIDFTMTIFCGASTSSGRFRRNLPVVMSSSWLLSITSPSVEVASYARLTSSGVANFIRSHIICRYGVPHELISDRGYISEQRLTP
ncbi:hypothetical protein CK203_022396 [Vitis vinifera]|uniref:Reverse transcriptase/retrotransposon-derived protein RNase H-like domain-containing protein n=1 Tax=Vitis vinifera TaxID=29760 RepID=A0A438I9I4_VITVI|nr:hypothetical protein CK203_022396 [Vitis vinifera]